MEIWFVNQSSVVPLKVQSPLILMITMTTFHRLQAVAEDATAIKTASDASKANLEPQR